MRGEGGGEQRAPASRPSRPSGRRGPAGRSAVTKAPARRPRPPGRARLPARAPRRGGARSAACERSASARSPRSLRTAASVRPARRLFVEAARLESPSARPAGGPCRGRAGAPARAAGGARSRCTSSRRTSGMCSPNFCAVQLDQPAAVLALLAPPSRRRRRRRPGNRPAGRRRSRRRCGRPSSSACDGEREDLLLGERRELTTEQSHSRFPRIELPSRPCWGDIRGRQSPKTACFGALSRARSINRCWKPATAANQRCFLPVQFVRCNRYMRAGRVRVAGNSYR